MDKDQGLLVSSLTFKKTDETTKPAIFECGEPISTVHLPLYVWAPEGWINTRETDLYSLIQINLGSETAEVLIIFNYAKHNVNVGVSVYHFHQSTLRLSVCIRLKPNYPEQIQIHQKVFFKIQNAHCQCPPLKSIFCLKKKQQVQRIRPDLWRLYSGNAFSQAQLPGHGSTGTATSFEFIKMKRKRSEDDSKKSPPPNKITCQRKL